MRILTVLVAIGCLAALIFGSIHWEQKISKLPAEGVIASANIEGENKKANNEKEQKKSNQINVKDLASSLPKDVADLFNEASSSGETIELAIIGSGAITAGENVWPEIFKEKISDAYGNLVNVTVYEIPGMTTSEVVEANLHMESLDISPDVVIFEPFMLEDNGLVGIDQTLVNIQEMLEDIRTLNENAYFFLQPPHPVEGAIYYPIEVEALKEMAEEEGHTFIDHWSNWPDYQTAEIKPYITEDYDAPTELGHEVWAEYIIDIFITEEKE